MKQGGNALFIGFNETFLDAAVEGVMHSRDGNNDQAAICTKKVG